jgi:segregation and condensation protein A
VAGAPGTLRPVPYAVRTEVFEGPFDLLLHLILKQEVDLFEVSLTRIVDAYIAELERMEALDLDVATEFLLIAATLVELKARRLLPSLEEVELDEEL